MKKALIGAALAAAGLTAACSSSGEPGPTVTVTRTVTAAPAPTQAAQAAAKSMRLDVKGDGITETKKFTVQADEWDIQYVYDCGGDQGNFQIYVYDGSGELKGVAANVLKASGHATSTEHGAGTYYLNVNTTCNWALNVYG